MRHLISLLLVVTTLSNSHVQADSKPVVSLLEMRHKNMVLQEWDLSCGAAALTTVLKYQHGIETTEREVATALIQRQEYIENPDLLQHKQGFSLLDLKRHVESLDLTGEGFGRLTINDLIQQAPVIVPVQIQNYNHFAVFRGIANNRVLLADPAWGNRVMQLSAFEKSWIDFGELGKIGFVVTSNEVDSSLNKLKPETMDFVMLR